MSILEKSYMRAILIDNKKGIATDCIILAALGIAQASLALPSFAQNFHRLPQIKLTFIEKICANLCNLWQILCNQGQKQIKKILVHYSVIFYFYSFKQTKT
ncbi:MAG: hypothetical protein U9Q98_03870 [Bacteroidota bacterium]|nr:hypothetical protein [Bacteroidota bacterium]